jgi:hypothetical protein
MFGYITIRKEELKMKDYATYKAFYCGLCRTLQESYGPIGQSTLTYDMTFFVLLLSSLYESKTLIKRNRCIVHPIKKQLQIRTHMSQYAADMNMIMSYYHLKDQWDDEKKLSGYMGAAILKGTYHKLCQTYPRQSAVIQQKMTRLTELEKNKSTDIDCVAGTFGDLLGEICVVNEDHWAESLRKFGFYLGKFIYIMDAYDDLEDDLQKKRYNPLKSLFHELETEAYEAQMNQILTMMMTEATEVFEKLPCLELADILRNILYVGVWEKYDRIQQKKCVMKGQNNDN